MGDIFLKLLNMSITAGWLVLAVLAVRLLFRKMPRWICCLLWGVVAIRLLVPFSIESVFSLQPSAEPIQSVTVVEGEIMPVPSIDSKLSFVETQVNPVLRDTFAYQKTEGVAPLQVVTEVAGGIWLVEKQKDVSSGKNHEEDFYEAMKESRYDSAMHFMSMYIKMVKGRDAAGIAALSDKEYSEREQELLDSKENEWMRYATAEFYDEKKTGEFTMKIMSADRAIIRYVDVIIRKDEESGKTYFVAEDIRE